jgi:type III secretory pathway component EscR
MSNKPTTKKQKDVLPSFHKALFKHNYKSASDHYRKYLDKILDALEVKFFMVTRNSTKGNNTFKFSSLLSLDENPMPA